MKIFITASGNSKRFTDNGYTIKPLIKINDKYIINYVMDMFPVSEKDINFVINDNDIHKYPIESLLTTQYPDSKLFTVPCNNLGPVYSVSHIFDNIPDNEEIIISYCDLTQNWDFYNFLDYCKNSNCDGCIVTHNQQLPHQFHNTSFAFLDVFQENVLMVNEKQPFSEVDINKQPSSNGIYYFKNGKLFKKYCHELLQKKICVNGEYYMTLPYNLMIRDNLKIIHYVVNDFICLGTPDDVLSFQSWCNLINKCGVTKDNINKVFNFWSKNVSLLHR